MTDLETVLRLQPQERKENPLGISIGVIAAALFIAVVAANAFALVFA